MLTERCTGGRELLKAGWAWQRRGVAAV